MTTASFARRAGGPARCPQAPADGSNLGRLLLMVLWAAAILGATADPAASQTVPRGAEFVASSRGQVFYWVGCTAWTDLKKSNLRFFEDREAAEAAGYRPSRSRGCAGPPPASLTPEACAVVRIVDGDTFVCRSGVRVRLLLIDAPETSQGSFGLRSTLALEELVPGGTVVTLRYDVQPRDRYGRALAHVYNDSVWVNRAMVRRGYALVSVYPPNVRGVEALRAAADSARTEEAGLWRLDGFRCRPADYRRGLC